MTLDADSLTLPLPDLVQKLSSIIGKKLTAYVAGAKDARTVDRLIEGELLSNDSEQRCRLAYQVATILSTYDSPAVVQAWLMGLNPELGDRVPIRLIREENLQQLAPLILKLQDNTSSALNTFSELTHWGVRCGLVVFRSV
jgi:hypothetical protein